MSRDVERNRIAGLAFGLPSHYPLHPGETLSEGALWIDGIQWVDLRDGAHIPAPGRWRRLLGLAYSLGAAFTGVERPRRPFMVMNIATSVIDGSYIGSPGTDLFSDDLFSWLRSSGIRAERRVDGDINGLSGTANIGFEPGARCWWGWSHRARRSFRPGDVIGRGHEFRIEYPELYPEGHVIGTMRGAKLAASRFAEMVS